MWWYERCFYLLGADIGGPQSLSAFCPKNRIPYRQRESDANPTPWQVQQYSIVPLLGSWPISGSFIFCSTYINPGVKPFDIPNDVYFLHALNYFWVMRLTKAPKRRVFGQIDPWSHHQWLSFSSILRPFGEILAGAIFFTIDSPTSYDLLLKTQAIGPKPGVGEFVQGMTRGNSHIWQAEPQCTAALRVLVRTSIVHKNLWISS